MIKCTCTVVIDSFRNISTNSSIQISVCRGSYDGFVKHKRNDPMCDPWDSQGNEKKMQFLFLLPFCLDILIRNENITSEECKKTPFEIILHVGRVTSLQNWKGSQK